MGIIPASLAVLNSTEGLRLKTQLDNLLLSLDNKGFLALINPKLMSLNSPKVRLTAFKRSHIPNNVLSVTTHLLFCRNY
jgi:hypothetical protein